MRLCSSGSGACICGKASALLGQLFQERRRRPEFAVLLLEFADAVIDLLKTHCIGIKHWTATIGGKSVAVEVDDVDIYSAQGDSFIQDSRALIHQREDAPFHNFFC